jgi:hypothetical protein
LPAGKCASSAIADVAATYVHNLTPAGKTTNIGIPAALQFKRSLQLAGLFGMATVAVMIPVRTQAGIQRIGATELEGVLAEGSAGDPAAQKMLW